MSGSQWPAPLPLELRPTTLRGVLGPPISDGRLWVVHDGFLFLDDGSSLAMLRRRGSLASSSDNSTGSFPVSSTSGPHRTQFSSSSTPEMISDHSASTSTASSVPSPDTTPEKARHYIKVVFKLCRPAVHPSAAEIELLNELTPEAAESAMLKEDRIYSGPLAPWQGRVVPRYYGLFRETSGLWVMVMEKAGPAICEDQFPLHRLPHIDKCVSFSSNSFIDALLMSQSRQYIEQSYSVIHKCDVIQQDIQPRHIRHNPGLDRHIYKYYIIDFEDAEHVETMVAVKEHEYLIERLRGNLKRYLLIPTIVCRIADARRWRKYG